MAEVNKKINTFFKKDLWEIDTASLNKYRSFIVKSLRMLNIAAHQFVEEQLTLRAMGLVYTTLLSIVPVLAISFSVLKAFGVHNEVVEPFLLNFLEPMGSKGHEITARIIGFVENIKAGVLGSIGIGMLMYTAVSVIQKVENSFNSIWRIKKPRSFYRRLSDYISVLIIGPVLIFSALGLTATLMSNTIVQKIISIEPFGTLFYFFAEKTPYIFVCAAFTFLYIFLPNTKVKLSSALTGGILAGIAWETAGWGFTYFIVASTKYTAIYSGFAILIMFMIWLYVSWLILLAGAQISFYHQYPYALAKKPGTFLLNTKFREQLAFSIMYFIGYNFYHNRHPYTLNSLSSLFKLNIDIINDILELLKQNELIAETADTPASYIPARDLETITLIELLNSVRIGNSSALSMNNQFHPVSEVESVISSIDNANSDALADSTLKDMVLSKKH